MLKNNLFFVAARAIAVVISCLLCNHQLLAGRPKYQLFRYNENWSKLAKEDKTNFFDGTKNIELGHDGNAWLSIGGQLRERVEAWSGFAFGGDNDDVFDLHRVFVHGDLHWGPNVRVFGEFINALSTSRDLPGGRRGLDVDSADLLNAFIDFNLPLGDANLTLRIGRQEFLFGKQRLISPLPWANTMRRWDAVSAILSTENWKIQAFASKFVPVNKYDFNKNDDNNILYGVYGTFKKSLDIYYLGRERDNLDSVCHTIGGRAFGKTSTGFDYDVEAAYQFGEMGAADIEAFMAGSQFGYAWMENQWKPRLWLGFDYGSGNNSPADGKLETFDQLFPLGHAYLGYIDIVGRQNIIDLSLGLDLKPAKKMGFKMAHHFSGGRKRKTPSTTRAAALSAREQQEVKKKSVAKSILPPPAPSILTPPCYSATVTFSREILSSVPAPPTIPISFTPKYCSGSEPNCGNAGPSLFVKQQAFFPNSFPETDQPKTFGQQKRPFYQHAICLQQGQRILNGHGGQPVLQFHAPVEQAGGIEKLPHLPVIGIQHETQFLHRRGSFRDGQAVAIQPLQSLPAGAALVVNVNFHG